MLVVGLTGGIGSGKSTFAALLVERGAHVVDADELARDAVRPGRPAWHSITDQFGDEVLVQGSLEIDRGKLADVVFADPDKLAALNAIVHPVVFEGVADALERLAHTDEIVVLDAALLLETGLHESVNVLVAVLSDRKLRYERLSTQRAMSPTQIEARMAAQISPQELEERADIVVYNNGTLDDLAREADRVWEQLQAVGRR